MNNFGNFNGYGQPVGGYPVAGQAPVAIQKVKITDPLTPEERAKLRDKNKGAAFTLTLSEDEELVAKCPHRMEDGSQALRPVDPANHIYRCALCGEVVDLTPVSSAELNKALDVIKNVLNQIKAYGLTLDESIYKEFMLIGPMMYKLPQLYAIANRNFAEVFRGIHPVQAPQNPRGSGFDVFNSIMDNTYSTRFGGGVNPAYTQGNVFVPGYGNTAAPQNPQQFYTNPNQLIQYGVVPQGQPVIMQQPPASQPTTTVDQMAAQIAALQAQVASMQQPAQPTAAQTQGAATAVAQPFAKTNG